MVHAAKCQARGTSTGPPPPAALGPPRQTRGPDTKHGYLSQYVPKQGTQYYKDLAGNVKEVSASVGDLDTDGSRSVLSKRRFVAYAKGKSHSSVDKQTIGVKWAVVHFAWVVVYM